MTDCALPCFMFTCVPSGNVKLIPDIGSAASAKPSAPSAITGRNIEPVVSEDGSSRSYLALFWDSRICLFASPTLSPRACIHLVMPRWYTWISLRKEVRRTFESWLSRTRYFFHAHSYRSSAVILLKILIWRQRYNDKRTCTRLHRGYAYFSFQHYLSFVERFVENMLSRKCLMFNTSFIIFNNSTKIRGVLSVIFMNRTHPPTSKNVMLMLQYLFTTVRQRQANKQARGHSTKGGCSSIEL